MSGRSIQRIAALLTALFLLLMLLFTAGHAIQHLHEQSHCIDCPVCLRLSVFARLLSAALLMMLFVAAADTARCLIGRYGQILWPALCGSTPVSNKVKMTN